MGWLLWLIIALCVIVTFVIVWSDEYVTYSSVSWFDVYTITTLWLFIEFLIILFFCTVIYNQDTKYPLKVSKTDTYEIVSASQNDKIEGNIYVWSGYIEEKSIYKAYRVMPNGYYKMTWMYADNTYIIETDDETPHIVEYTELKKDDRDWTRLKGALFGYNTKLANKWKYEETSHRGKIYIPKGTIKPSFDNLNL